MRTLLALAILAFVPLTALCQPPAPLSPPDAKAAFLKLLDRPKVPLDVQSQPVRSESNGALVSERLSFASEKKAGGTVERVPVLVVRPPYEPGVPGRRPCVIVLHGTGGNKEGVRSWLDEFARKGFVTVAIDARYHGDRVPGVKGSTAYSAAITKAWRTPSGQPHEHPFFYDTCWDLWRLVDYLRTRADVNPDRIGMIGISMGGIQTWLAASVDDRVRVACPLIAVQSFRWSLENEKWQGRARTIMTAHVEAAKDLGEPGVNTKVCRELWSKVIPGITGDFDCPNLLPLFVDRPLFIANGELDPNCPIEGARIAIRAAEAAYDRAKSRGKLEVHIANGVAHKVTDEQRVACVAFCEKWLTKK